MKTQGSSEGYVYTYPLSEGNMTIYFPPRHVILPEGSDNRPRHQTAVRDDIKRRYKPLRRHRRPIDTDVLRKVGDYFVCTPSGPVYPYQLDESISNFRGVLFTFFIFNSSFDRNSCKQTV